MNLIYVYCGEWGTFTAPQEILDAAGEPSSDGRTRFARALNAWGRWMDLCAMQRFIAGIEE